LPGGKLRSNTVISQQKVQDVPFETGLDAEFLNLFDHSKKCKMFLLRLD